MERKLEPNARFVPKSVLPLRVGRAADVDLRLMEPTVSRHHAVIKIRDGELVVRDLESTFGTFVNGQRIRERRLKAEDDIRFGQVVLYRVRADGLERTEQRGAGLHVQGLEIAVRDRVLVSFGLYSWSVAPGQFVGILGPSGAGKSMLLRTLAGVRPPSRGVISCGQLSNIWEAIDEHR
jgi:ABC-type glutathione transport system ATPase component